jgi:acyl carrier protein
VDQNRKQDRKKIMPELPKSATAIESIEQLLCAELQPLQPGKVTAESTLASIGVDSLKLVSLLLVIEQKFGVNLMKIGLKPQDMVSVRSLAAAVKEGQRE